MRSVSATFSLCSFSLWLCFSPRRLPEPRAPAAGFAARSRIPAEPRWLPQPSRSSMRPRIPPTMCRPDPPENTSSSKSFDEDVFSGGSGLHIVGGMRGLIDERDGCGSHRGSAGILDRAANPAAGALGSGKRRGEKHSQSEKEQRENVAETERIAPQKSRNRFHELPLVSKNSIGG